MFCSLCACDNLQPLRMLTKITASKNHCVVTIRCLFHQAVNKVEPYDKFSTANGVVGQLAGGAELTLAVALMDPFSVIVHSPVCRQGFFPCCSTSVRARISLYCGLPQ